MPMSSQSYRRTLAVLLVLGIALRVALIVLYPMSTQAEMLEKPGDEAGYFTRAWSILERGSHVDGNGKMAYFPPGYALYLAANLAVFGDNRTAIQVTQNIVFLGCVLLLAGIVRRRLGEAASLWSLAILLLNPVWFIVPQEAVSENLMMPVLLGALAFSLRAMDAPRLPWVIAAGVMFGLSALTREIGLVYGVVVSALLWAACRRRSEPAAWRPPAVLLLCMALTVAPWTARNYRIYGQLVPITTNSKINLYIGNNPEANGEFHWRLPDGMGELWNTPSPNGKNELIVSNRSGEEAVRYVLTHPGPTLALWPRKLALFWSPHPLRGETTKPVHSTADSLYRLYRSSWWVASLLLGLPGLWLMRRSALGWLLLGIAGSSTLIHMLTYVRIEYRQPVDFLFAIPIAACITHLASRRRGRRNGVGAIEAEPVVS